MLDALLANQLVKAVAPGTHLLLVGDPDQLPSVGAGDVLADLLRVRAVPGHAPDAHLPPGGGLGIAANARRINAGQLPALRGRDRRLLLPAGRDPAEAAQLVVDLVAQRLPARYGFQVGRGPGAVADAPRRGRRRGPEHACSRSGSTRRGRACPRRGAGGGSTGQGTGCCSCKNDYTWRSSTATWARCEAVDPIEQELLVALDDGREVRYPSPACTS